MPCMNRNIFRYITLLISKIVRESELNTRSPTSTSFFLPKISLRGRKMIEPTKIPKKGRYRIKLYSESDIQTKSRVDIQFKRVSL